VQGETRTKKRNPVRRAYKAIMNLPPGMQPSNPVETAWNAALLGESIRGAYKLGRAVVQGIPRLGLAVARAGRRLYTYAAPHVARMIASVPFIQRMRRHEHLRRMLEAAKEYSGLRKALDVYHAIQERMLAGAKPQPQTQEKPQETQAGAHPMAQVVAQMEAREKARAKTPAPEQRLSEIHRTIDEWTKEKRAAEPEKKKQPQSEQAEAKPAQQEVKPQQAEAKPEQSEAKPKQAPEQAQQGAQGQQQGRRGRRGRRWRRWRRWRRRR